MVSRQFVACLILASSPMAKAPQPLSADRAFLKSRSFIEYVLFLIPILGWIAASMLEQRRTLKGLAGAGQEMESRDSTCIELWKGDADKRAFIEFVNGLVRDGLGWPNAYFIPADPFWVIFADDDGVLLNILQDIEERFGIPSEVALNASEQWQKVEPELTYGDWIDRLWELFAVVRGKEVETRQ